MSNQMPHRPAIVATDSISTYFHQAVGDAIRARQVDATVAASSYLVGLLTDYAHPEGRAGEALERPLAILLDEAMHTTLPAERFDKLKSLGDGVLYSCGFFSDHFEARGVEQRYLVGIGQTAYGNAASMLKKKEKAEGLDLYRELADNFTAFVGVLVEIADRSVTAGVKGSRDLVRVYERWLKTGSDGLAQALAAHGLVPVRGTKGVVQ